MEPVFIGGLSDADLKFGIDINIQRNGYFPLIIQDPQSSFCRCYTIGLSSIGHPELTMQGAEAPLVYKFMHHLAHDVMYHQLVLGHGMNIRWYGSTLNFEEIGEACRFAPEAAKRYGPEITLLEVWCPDDTDPQNEAPEYVIG
ncbi:hypothetical protein OK351_08770 [Glutamicibacter sp. MNS18]|uniref:hypothetical protein n=1 Tax=Glutamicibacter sp. MNS18 TaxID=2989817 RepID=UPI002236C000|nr:hypothetical protein [Glutamicibacter sp. MNS18]MCW4465596.1 hypothetical protein [Glutamicibacter sp. MNS18]